MHIKKYNFYHWSFSLQLTTSAEMGRSGGLSFVHWGMGKKLIRKRKVAKVTQHGGSHRDFSFSFCNFIGFSGLLNFDF